MRPHARRAFFAVTLLGLASWGTAGQIVMSRDRTDGQPVGVARTFASAGSLWANVTLDNPLSSPRIHIKLVGPSGTVLDRDYDLQGDRRNFGLRLTISGGTPRPGEYHLTISHGGRIVAETIFSMLAAGGGDSAPRVYYGRALPEGADPFTKAGLPAGVTAMSAQELAAIPEPPAPDESETPGGDGTPPATGPPGAGGSIDQIVIARNVVDGKPVEAGDIFTGMTKIYAVFSYSEMPPHTSIAVVLSASGKDTTSQMQVGGTGTGWSWWSTTRAGGFAPGSYRVTIRRGDQLLARQDFTIR